MTRRRLKRLVRRYNADRRVLRGWQGKRWDVLVAEAYVAGLSDAEYEWWLRMLSRLYEEVG